MKLKIKCVICGKVIANPIFGEWTCRSKECSEQMKAYLKLSEKEEKEDISPSPK